MTGTIRARGFFANLGIATSGAGNPLFKTRSGGTVDVNGGGTVTILAAGSIEISGADFTADGMTSEGCFGGTILLQGTTLTINKAVHADACVDGDGGIITMNAQSGSVNLMGTPGQITANAGSGIFTSGGTITVTATTTIVEEKTMQAKASGDSAFGGTIQLSTIATGLSGQITVTGSLNTTTSNSLASQGGIINITGGAVTTTAPITSKSAGFGGDVDITANGGAISIGDAISVDGLSLGDGGIVSITGNRGVTINGAISANGVGADSVGGVIAIGAGTNHTLAIFKALEAKVPNSGLADGSISLEACFVTLDSAVRTRNTAVADGLNVISYRGGFAMAAGADLLADDPAATSCSQMNGNIVRCRCPDANNDTICDSATCVSSPTFAGTVTPTAKVCPTVMPPCQ